MYMSGSIHYLTWQQAMDTSKAGDAIRHEDDGTYSVYRLQPTPRQHGQAKWVGSLKDIKPTATLKTPIPKKKGIDFPCALFVGPLGNCTEENCKCS